VPLLDWLAVSAAGQPDCTTSLSDIEAERATTNDVLTEDIERLRRRRWHAAYNAGLERLVARLYRTNPDPMPVAPLDRAHARQVQALALLRRQFAERTIQLWGHYGRPGTLLELVPVAPIDIVDLPKNRLQLAGDLGFWCSLEVADVATEPLSTRPDHPVAKARPAPVNAAAAKAKMLVTIKAEMLRRHRLDGLAGQSYSKIAADMVEFAKAAFADVTSFKPPQPKHMATLIRDYLKDELKVPQGTGGRSRRRSDRVADLNC
jgi:hypothetical protein